MNRWGVLILVAPALLLVGSVLYEPEALGHPLWPMLAIVLVAFFGFLALLASTSVSRVGRAIIVIAVAREAAQKLSVPNVESKPLYRVGRNSHTGEVWVYVEWTWVGLL